MPLLRRSDSHPSIALPLQLAKFALHAPIAQTPAVQLAPAFAYAHATPQPPQFVRVSSAASQPLAGLPSQSPKPGSQRRPHAPVAQNAVAFGPDGQTVPHAPHAAGSFTMLRQAPLQFVSPAPHDAPHAPFEQT